MSIFGIIGAGTVERRENPVVLEASRIGGKPGARRAVANRPCATRADVVPKFDFQSRRQRCREAEAPRRFDRWSDQQARRRRDGAEDADGRRGMPAFFIMVKMHAARYAALGLITHDISQDQVAAG